VIAHRDMSDYSDDELMAIIRAGADELGLTKNLPIKTVLDAEIAADGGTLVGLAGPVVQLVASRL